MIRIYGIKNCDTMKKAFAWLEAKGMAYEFIDYKKAGVVESHLPDEVDVLLDMEQESLADLNALAQVADTLSTDDLKKLGAVVAMAKPETAAQIKRLAENLELFDFAPDAHTPEEYLEIDSIVPRALALALAILRG